MQFKYIASQPDGSIVESEVDATSKAEVLNYLINRGLKPVSIKPVAKDLIEKAGIFGGRINLTDQIFISKYLALMLKIGMGLLQAVNILIEDFDKRVVKSLLLEVRTGIEKGQPFYLTFARYPKVFSQVYINLIKAGEASGNLEVVFENLSTSLTKEKALKDQIRGALIYPILLLSLSILILIFLVTFAIPKIAGVFLESGFKPPLFSRVVFSVGLFFGKYWVFILGGGALVIFSLFYLYNFSILFRKLITSSLQELPVVKKLAKKIALQRFAATLSPLIRAGLPLTESLEITAEAVSQVELKDALLRISREGLARGLTVGEAFKREPFFPKTVINLVAISEKAGHLEDVLSTLADFYIGEVDNALKTLVAFLEPVLLLFIGVIIGGIALAIIIPIYQLTTQF